MKFITTLLLFCFAVSHAQYSISGVVTDEKSALPIAFATIRKANKDAKLADSNGRFTVEADSIEQLNISHIGYVTKNLNINPTRYVNIRLSQSSASKVGQSADEIMRQVIRHKVKNDPQKGSKSFELKAYTRLVITANADSIDGRIDTIHYKRPRKGSLFKLDSSDYRFKKIIEKQHLFQTEKVSEFSFAAGALHETIIGTKMAGFQEPVYEVYGFQLLPFSIYSDPLIIFETRYNNPLADDSYKHYNFKVLDTISIKNRKVWAVHFSPIKTDKQSSLQGLLLIDQENFGIANATIIAKGMIDIVSEQTSVYSEVQYRYFPSRSSIRIVKGKNEKDIVILGQAIRLAASPTAENNRKYASDYAYLLSESTYFDYRFDAAIQPKPLNVTIDIPNDAIQKSDEFWKFYRRNVLSQRSINTYSVLDSIAEKRGVESKLIFGRKIINGYLPLGLFDADLRHLISFNNYEGFRLGFGGRTNNKFSKIFRIYGYTAYGTKDGNFKYQLGNALRLNQYSDTWVGIAYTDDVREIASTDFVIDKRSFKIYDPRPINISTFYNYVSWKAYMDTKIIPGTESTWQVSHEAIRPLFDYYFNFNDKIYRNFSLSLAMISLQWNPFSDYMQTPNGRIEIVKRYPKFTFQATKAFRNVLGNELEFSKLEVRADYEKKFINRQKISFLLEAGYASGQVPITHAYNTSPNNLNKEKLFGRITFAGKDSFETMFFNEFFSDRFVFSQYKYSLNRLKISKQITPTPVLVSRMVWGDMNDKSRHHGLDFKTLDHGFYESGIELNGIFKGLGLSAFYRHGANHLPRFEDNLAIKLSFVFSIGF